MSAAPGKVTLFIACSILNQSTLHLNQEHDPMSLFQSIVKGDFNPISDQDSSIEKSVKFDDAAAPVSLWNVKLFDKVAPYIPEKHDRILENLRNLFAMPWYRRDLFRSYRNYMRRKYGSNWHYKLAFLRRRSKKEKRVNELLKDGDVGTDAIGRAVNSDWWNWSYGSCLHFWRLPQEA